MTQEEKQLLLQDICSRLPYGVITKNCRNNFDVPAHLLSDVIGIKLLIDEYDLKPYLRPMSSMTEEEKEIYKSFCDEDIRQLTYVQEVHPSLKQKTSCHRSIDWLNAHHFDYRGLIPMGLALEAPEDMYKNI